MSTSMTRRAAVTGLAAAPAALAAVPAVADTRNNTDTLLSDLWAERAKLRGVADRATDEASRETRWNDVNDLEDRIFALLATDIARTPVVVAVDALLMMIEHGRLFETPASTSYRMHSLLPRLERVLPDLTGRLADDVREIVEYPQQFLGLTGALLGEGDPSDFTNREPYKSNPLRSAESAMVMAALQLSAFYDPGTVSYDTHEYATRRTRIPHLVEIIYGGDPAVPDKVTLSLNIDIDGRLHPDAQADIAEWWEMKQRYAAERVAS